MGDGKLFSPLMTKGHQERRVEGRLYDPSLRLSFQATALEVSLREAWNGVNLEVIFLEF
jgi:hypothetical protein